MTIDEIKLDSLQKELKNLPLGGILFYPQSNSTNDLALDWAANDAKDLSLVITNHQTAGRGRKNRQWISPKDSSLTFSLIMFPFLGVGNNFGLYSAIGALAVINAIKKISDKVNTKIKWPNDILINGKKVCGILVETSWTGTEIERVIIGIGINVSKEAVPQADLLMYPATSLEDILGRHVNKVDLLRRILDEIVELRETKGSSELIDAWEENLAFRDSVVEITEDGVQTRVGILAGLAQDGALRLVHDGGQESIIHFGEMHLRPATSKDLSSKENKD